jgi:hypothetical protein
LYYLYVGKSIVHVPEILHNAMVPGELVAKLVTEKCLGTLEWLAK